MGCLALFGHMKEVMTHDCVLHDFFMFMCVVTHSCGWGRDSWLCVAWLMFMCAVTHSCGGGRACVLHDSCVPWLIDVEAVVTTVFSMTHVYVCHDLFTWMRSCMCVAWLMFTCAVSHSCGGGCDSWLCVAWLMFMCAVSGSCESGHVSCVCVRALTHLDVTGLMRCVAVCCSVLQCVAVCCSVLQCVALTHSDVTGLIQMRPDLLLCV